MATEPQLLRDAELISSQVRLIWHLLRRQLQADIASSGLTVPQLSTLEVLAEGDGLSLTELSRQLGLAHSTVSGIVDRLEKQGLVARRPDPKDRRYTQIVISEPVRRYLEETLPRSANTPLVMALQRATPEQREQIVTGLVTLRRLLETAAGGPAAGQTAAPAAGPPASP